MPAWALTPSLYSEVKQLHRIQGVCLLIGVWQHSMTCDMLSNATKCSHLLYHAHMLLDQLLKLGQHLHHMQVLVRQIANSKRRQFRSLTGSAGVQHRIPQSFDQPGAGAIAHCNTQLHVITSAATEFEQCCI